MFQVRESYFPQRSLNLYAPFPSTSITSYGPSHLGPSFPVSSVRLASLLRYTRSTFAVLSVGMPISAGMTTSVPYVNENGVSSLLGFIIVRPWLRCVGPLQSNYVLREIHEGSCSMYVGTRSVVAKALRTGYYWPTMHKDARTLIRACQDCQVHKPVPRNPQQKLTPNKSPWPFYK
uniref:Reverse transcriptase domain-containing protein n=1 Tax=Tanacetum cinerariifolium TaxID=118510 RepID=A0A699KZF2_TANCI|nr:reverse transcriptase domain-containing protein [Tanacetum cinerariifolium]